MDVPITKPSMVSYADDLNFEQLLENLYKDKHNGFMRITVDENEGIIIFKDGQKVAAEYNRFFKNEALEKILPTAENADALIEVFDLKPSHMDYILEVNKPFLLETDQSVSEKIAQLRGMEEPEPPVPENDSVQSGTDFSAEFEPVNESEEPVFEPVSESETENTVFEPEATSEAEIPEEEPVPEQEPVIEPEKEPEIDVSEIKPDLEVKTDSKVEEPIPVMPELNQKEPKTEPKEPMDRSKLLAKYGIKEMDEDDVDLLLDTYKGGSLNDEDMEKIELTLMNKIKKSIFGIPKIKGTEVMVFLENTSELQGEINILIEYATKGFLSRIRGESQDIENLRRQVINIVQIEIKKSFRKYPQMVDNFNINVEIS